jgi:hypothetical protein
MDDVLVVTMNSGRLAPPEFALGLETCDFGFVALCLGYADAADEISNANTLTSRIQTATRQVCTDLIVMLMTRVRREV